MRRLPARRRFFSTFSGTMRPALIWSSSTTSILDVGTIREFEKRKAEKEKRTVFWRRRSAMERGVMTTATGVRFGSSFMGFSLRMFLGVMFMNMDGAMFLVLYRGVTEFRVEEVDEFLGVEVVGGADGIGFYSDAAIGKNSNFEGVGHSESFRVEGVG